MFFGPCTCYDLVHKTRRPSHSCGLTGYSLAGHFVWHAHLRLVCCHTHMLRCGAHSYSGKAVTHIRWRERREREAWSEKGFCPLSLSLSFSQARCAHICCILLTNAGGSDMSIKIGDSKFYYETLLRLREKYYNPTETFLNVLFCNWAKDYLISARKIELCMMEE